MGASQSSLYIQPPVPQNSVACVIVEVMTGCRLIVMTGAAHQTLIILHIQVRLGAVLRVGADPVLELDTGVTTLTCPTPPPGTARDSRQQSGSGLLHS